MLQSKLANAHKLSHWSCFCRYEVMNVLSSRYQTKTLARIKSTKTQWKLPENILFSFSYFIVHVINENWFMWKWKTHKTFILVSSSNHHQYLCVFAMEKKVFPICWELHKKIEDFSYELSHYRRWFDENGFLKIQKRHMRTILTWHFKELKNQFQSTTSVYVRDSSYFPSRMMMLRDL